MWTALVRDLSEFATVVTKDTHRFVDRIEQSGDDARNDCEVLAGDEATPDGVVFTNLPTEMLSRLQGDPKTYTEPFNEEEANAAASYDPATYVGLAEPLLAGNSVVRALYSQVVNPEANPPTTHEQFFARYFLRLSLLRKECSRRHVLRQSPPRTPNAHNAEDAWDDLDPVVQKDRQKPLVTLMGVVDVKSDDEASAASPSRNKSGSGSSGAVLQAALDRVASLEALVSALAAENSSLKSQVAELQQQLRAASCSHSSVQPSCEPAEPSKADAPSEEAKKPIFKPSSAAPAPVHDDDDDWGALT